MRIVLTTPTGNIGSVVARRLLATDHETVLVVRDAAKVKDLASRGAVVIEGSHGDEATMLEATRGADALFWLTPPAMIDDYPKLQREFGSVAAAVIKANAIPRVVHLSSVGAHVPEGNGPVDGLYVNENLLNSVATNITHLRAGYFMENFLSHRDSIAESRSLFLPVDPDIRIPMVATRDIAAVAAECLLDTGWNGIRHVGVHGPADLSHNEAARSISEALGFDVAMVQVPRFAAAEAMVGMGLPASWVEEMLELFDGLNAGTLQPEEPRTAESTTPTTLKTWATDVLRPLI